MPGHTTSRLVLLAALVAPLVLACAGAPDGATGTPTQRPAGNTPTPSARAAQESAAGLESPTTTPGRTPGPTVPRVPPLQPPAYASRVVVADLDIDLPVISGDLQPPPNYPLCDVAAYLTRFNQPYETGVTYISAHAQEDMFQPLLEASQRQDGAELLGLPVSVYTSDGRLFEYRIVRVVRHATDYAVLADIDLGQRNLILQTSEGPFGTLEKLQVLATFETESTVDPAEAAPEAHPRDCRPTESAEVPPGS